MKQIITIQKIKSCKDCPFLNLMGAGGWYGNSSAGGYCAYCKKRYNKKLCEIKYHSPDEAEHERVGKEYNRVLNQIPDWCPLEDYTTLEGKKWTKDQ